MTTPGGESAGTVHVDVVPDASGFAAALRARVLPAAEAVGQQVAARVAAPIASSITDAVEDGVRRGGTAALPAADTVGRTIGIRIGRQIRDGIEAQLRRAISVTVRATVAGENDVTRLSAAITALRALGTTVNFRVRATVAGQNEINRMALAVQRLQTAARSPIHVRASATVNAPLPELSQLIRDLRALRRISDIHIRIRVDGVFQAMADIQTIAAFARTLGTLRPEITVSVNATIAIAVLATVLGMAAAVGAQRPTVTVNVNISGLLPAQAGLAAVQAGASSASLGVAGLTAALVVLASIAIPIVAALTIALFAVATAATAAIAALGVIALAAVGVASAVAAVTAAQAEQGKAAAQNATRQNAIRSALDGVRNAERGLANAQREAKRAQEDLTRARKEAKEANEDLALSVRGNALARERASDDLADAERELRRVEADPRATADQRREARLTYEEAKLQVDELATRGKRLAEQQEEANRKGIEGSAQVVAAKDRIRAADEALIQAQQQLAAAHRQAAQAATQAATQQNAAIEKARQALAGLSPQGRAFVAFIVSLRDELRTLQQAAERTFLPGLQRGLEAFLPVLPLVVRFVERFGAALGLLAEQALKALTGPFWVQFFDWLGTEGVAILVDFAKSIGFLVTAFAALIQAFGPTSRAFSSGLVDMTRRFAEWAQAVAQSEGFQKFTAYAVEQGPKLVQVLGDLGIVLIKLAIALTPLATLTLDLLARSLEWMAEQDPGVILAIAAAIAVLVAAISGGPIAIGVAVALIVAGLVYLYNRFETFRNTVNAVWAAWSAAAKWYWDNIVRPVFEAIAWYLTEKLAPAYLWLWRNVIQPAWTGISTAAQWAWENVLQPVFRAIAWVITNVVGPAFTWLWHNIITPAWAGIKVVIDIAWAALQVIFGLIQIALRLTGAVFLWLYEHAVKPAFDRIAAVIAAVWGVVRPILQVFAEFLERHVAPQVDRGVSAIGRIWERLRALAAAPVRFIIDTVLNNGLLAAYNAVAKRFGIKPDDVRINIPAFNTAPTPGGDSGSRRTSGFQEFARGGYVSGPGSSTSDSILARLSNGEYVIPASKVREYGVEFFDWLAGRTRKNPDHPLYAEGGLVSWVKSAWNTVTDPIGTLASKAGDLVNQIPGAGIARDVVVGVGRNLVGGVMNFLRSKIGFGGGGEGGPGPGFLPWPSSPGAQRGDTGVWRSIMALVRASGIPYTFGNSYRHGDPLWHGSGRAVDLMGYNQDALASFFEARQSNVLELIHRTKSRDYGITRGRRRNFPTQWPLHRNHIHIAMARGGLVGSGSPYAGMPRMGTFDSGGWLMPGITVAGNFTGRPERILTSQQWDDLSTRADQSASYTTNIYPLKASLSIEDLRAYDARRAALARVGRPR